MATALKGGQRWITVKKEGPLHGRRLLIDGKGVIVGGRIPRAMQGHNIKDLATIKPDESTSHYDNYSHEELHDIHKDFSAHHAEMKKELDNDVHGYAKHLRDQELEADDSINLVRRIRKNGGIKLEDGNRGHAEYKESVHPGVRKAVSHKDGKGLDEMADELGMNANELTQKLAQMNPHKYTKIEDYYDKAKQEMGDDYTGRKAAVDELEKHVKAIAAAKNRKKADKDREAAAKAKEKAPEKGDAAGVKDEAYDKLKQNYPEDTLGWAKDAKWSKQDGVDLKDIDMARRPGGRDMGKVNGIAGDVKDGKKTDRVHLVRTPNGKKLKIADGYHRTLGHLKAGAGKVDAYVADVQDDNGPWDREMHDKKLNLSDAEKAKQEAAASTPTANDGNGPTADDKQDSTASAPTADDKQDSTATAPTANDGVKRRGDRLDTLHDDVSKYMRGEGDANELLKKHDRLIKAMARNVAEKRGGDAEDLAQEGRTSAYKTLEALKNGTQKPKEGQHLGEHLLRRVKQGLSEGARQSNERPLSRESQKLAALVNSHKQAHMNETGQEPSEDELFNRVSKDDGFNKAKFAAPGTKKNIEDPREKFDALRGAMKNQKSQATLDEAATDDEGGNMGTKGSQIADSGETPEQAVLRKEAEQEMEERKGQVHDALSQFGLSPGERHAVIHRFGVGHEDATGAVLPWDKVAEHMSKDLGKQVNPETAKKHFNNGRAKLHKHIGDERMGLLMQKSLLEDVGVHLLIKQLYELGLYDILKSHGLENEDALDPVITRTAVASSYAELIKSLDAPEYVGEYQRWADGSISASIVQYRIRG